VMSVMSGVALPVAGQVRLVREGCQGGFVQMGYPIGVEQQQQQQQEHNKNKEQQQLQRRHGRRKEQSHSSEHANGFVLTFSSPCIRPVTCRDIFQGGTRLGCIASPGHHHGCNTISSSSLCHM
jgi:hypothetical protein